MPFGFLALTALAFYLGFPALIDLTDLILRVCHHGLAAVSGVFKTHWADALDLDARRALAPLLATLWGTGVALRLGFGAIGTPEDDGSLGYVVPGSGVLARGWAVIGKRLWQLKQAVVFLARYLRDINLTKIYVPVAVPLLLLLAWTGLGQALQNVLHEIPARFEGFRASTGWITPCARITAAVVVLMLGIPMLVNTVLRAHQKSVRLRTEKNLPLVRRLLQGFFGLLLVLPPLGWMALQMLAGRLD
jgi:hypothetical protein